MANDTSPKMHDAGALLEGLRAKEHRGKYTIGGGSIGANGEGSSWGGEKIMEWRNPDGPEAADYIATLTTQLAEREAEIAALKREVEQAREVFLSMIADAHRYEPEYDGDETGGWVSYHLHVGSGFEELAEALGVKPPGYMEGWPDAIDRAVAEPLASQSGETNDDINFTTTKD